VKIIKKKGETMIIKEYSKEYKMELLEALEKTKDLGCPPDKYRVKGHTNCFRCNECWRYALLKSMEIEID
jgi:hypothetical protein